MLTGLTRRAATAALLVFGAATSAGAQASPPAPFQGLDAYVTRAMQAWKVPGMAIAIVRNDSVLYTKGFGVLALNGHTQVDDRTLFEIGSSSKAFTATLVAMLVTDGKMHFDDRVTSYLPDFRLYDPVANEGVTIRDALTHRSGMARGELVWIGSGFTRDQVLHHLRFLKPESPFRSRWSYQNIMYLAAGEAAAKAAGTTWDDLVKQRIFVPLGMTSTVTTWQSENPNVTTPHGIDHDSVYVKPHMDMTNIAPAGAIMSNARDMAQWLRFQLADGVRDGKRLVGVIPLKETHSPQILMAPGIGRGGGAADSEPPVTLFSSYGMGWMVEDYHHHLMWQHGGNTDGMTTAVGMLPEDKLGVVVLSNMNGSQLPAILMHYIFDRQIGAPQKDLSAEAIARYQLQRRRADSVQVAQAGERVHGEPQIPLSAYAGTYADSLYGEATVTFADGKLELHRGLWHGPLEYWNAANFRWTISPSSPTGPMFIKFDVSPEGKVNGMYFGLGADATLLARKEQGGRRGGRGRGGAP